MGAFLIPSLPDFADLRGARAPPTEERAARAVGVITLATGALVSTTGVSVFSSSTDTGVLLSSLIMLIGSSCCCGCWSVVIGVAGGSSTPVSAPS